MALAIDALDTTISPAAIKDAGYSAVLNYLRNVTPATVAGYHAAGLGFASIYETAATESLGGAAAGARDGAQAAALMVALGQPKGTLHTVNLTDFAATPTELSAIAAYWEAYAAQVAGWPTLPYGTGWLLGAMATSGWQNAMDDNGVPGSAVTPQAAMYQRVSPTLTIPGASYDEDVVIASLPFWGAVPPAPPVPTPAPVPLGDNVLAVSFNVTTDSSGMTATDVTLPAAMTKNNVVNVEMDGSSPYDSTVDPWECPAACVDFKLVQAGICRVIVKGNPNHFYTGRVFVA